MTVRLLVGDCRAMLATLPAASVHACITSPPYFALRRYLDPSDPLAALEMGSESTPEQFVANLVAVFREVRRVLHPSGVCIVNLGDSYAGSGKGPTGHNGIGDQAGRQGVTGSRGKRMGSVHGESGHTSGVTPPKGYKAKDLMQMPARVAMALQADGWFLRSAMPWLKRAAMPESVTDRPSNALEWLFLFSKAPRYFWDAEAIRQRESHGNAQRSTAHYDTAERYGAGNGGNGGLDGLAARMRNGESAGRAFRNTDPWFMSLDSAIADARADLARLEAMRATGGVLTDDDGLPLAVDVNPQGFPGAHFATFSPNLVIPFVRAGSSSRGACPRCLAPWARSTERRFIPQQDVSAARVAHRRDTQGVPGQGWKGTPRGATQTDTLGWQPACACDAGEPIPCTVLDPFAGSGTTLLVADRLGRDAVGIELSPEYARMAEARIAGDAPLLNGLAEFEPEVVQDKQGALGKRTYTGFNARWKAQQDGLAAVEETAGDYAPLGLFEGAAS